MSDIQKAKQLLENSDNTCVICGNGEVFTSQKHGVAPLLGWLDEGKSFNGYSAADKVVGNGAAFLYVVLGVREVYAGVISESALQTLTTHDITVTYATLTEMIRNRDNTGQCPIEASVAGITSPDQAIAAIRKRLSELKNAQVTSGAAKQP